MNGTERTIGVIVRELMESMSVLVRGEIDLVKLEVRQSISRLGAGGGMFAAAVILAFFGVGLVLTTLVLLLSRFMPAWGAALLVAVGLFVVAFVLAAIGRARVREAGFRPQATIDSMRSDLDAIRSDIDRRRRERDDERS